MRSRAARPIAAAPLWQQDRGKVTMENYERVLDTVNTCSRPSDLRITDMKFADITNAPMHCTLMKIETNQGITGFGEVRDWAFKEYALLLKSRLLGENPCDIDRLFRKIKPFGAMSRAAGGVCAVELSPVGYCRESLWSTRLSDV